MAQDGRPQPRQQQGRLRRGFALLDHSLEQNHINKHQPPSSMIKDQQQKQQQGRNQPALVGESSGSQPTDVLAQQQAPPPAYTPNPVFQGLPMASSGQPNEDDLWHPPATMAEADRRARGRFIRALAVGFLIYVLALCLFGAPVEDSIEHSRPAPPPRHRHDRSGRPVITVVASPPPMPTGATAGEEPLTASVVVEQQ